jgi:hypothetical protein
MPNLQGRRTVLQREAARRHLSGTEVGKQLNTQLSCSGVSLPETRKSGLQIYKKMEARGGESSEIWHDALTNRLNRLRVPESPYKMGIDMIFVECHREISSPACLRPAYDLSRVYRHSISIDMDAQTHWENIYGKKAPDAVSWYRAHLETSLELVELAAPARAASIIDVGGGESTLVDDLFARGYQNVTVLDISQIAIDMTQKRAESQAGSARTTQGPG